ncbi:MAG TPA: TylF/MycF/NovP-related O-methyltransferase [Pyrinomonadaceae bacterium]|nr:TylF/MycF/NovP-related O-methyltransferase [Pyrinomonadaceae bacterium]
MSADPEQNARRIVSAVYAGSLTYLEETALHDLCERVREVEDGGRIGVLLECGCALGGSAIVMAAAKSKQRHLYVYDVFGMPPPATEDDGPDGLRRYEVIKSGQSEGIHGSLYYGYVENLLQVVTENFRKHGLPIAFNKVHLIKGLIQDTLRISEPVALAHIDCDRYESVMTCLQRVEPHLIKGGVMVVDDYLSKSGCRKAVDEYFRSRAGEYEFVFKSRLHIVRQ